jgi:hypothetical protein
MTDQTQAIRDLLLQRFANRPAVVLCGRDDDAAEWRLLLDAEHRKRCLPVALDTAGPGGQDQTITGATGHLAWQHSIIAGLDGSGWLSRAVDAFDPDQQALLVVPDPLDPPAAGARPRFGRRPSAWRLLEDKTVVDTVWDILGIRRAPAIVVDPAVDSAAPAASIDQGAGVVCSAQSSGGTVMAGGDGVRWWRRDRSTSPPYTQLSHSARLRLMPLLEGLPVRLHGFVLPASVVCFPSMEIVALPRPEHSTFLCAGTVRLPVDMPDLIQGTEDIGAALRFHLGYRGAFAVDGIISADGFMPTDFNARLTSAIEDTSSDLRVLTQATNLLIREGIELDHAVAHDLVETVFSRKTAFTIYGAASQANVHAETQTNVTWSGSRLVVAQSRDADGHLTLTPCVRGWQLTARLHADRLPTAGPLGLIAPEVFRFSDRIWGTHFGELLPPFGANLLRVPTARDPTPNRESRQVQDAESMPGPAPGR